MKWIRAAIAAAAAISCCGAIAAGPATADPAADDLSRHPALALAPGVGIVTYGTDTRPGGQCTAGWLVHDADGQPGLLTAGHCDEGGGAAYYDARHGFEGIGRFTHDVYQGNDGEDADIAELGIGNYAGAQKVATDTRIIGVRPVLTPVDPNRLAEGQILCHYGLATGPAPQCGVITYISASKVVFAAKVEPGDSGGPVYYRNADGTATPVAIATGASRQGSGTVAELIGPWLQRWQLSLDTTPPAAGRAPVGFRPR